MVFKKSCQEAKMNQTSVLSALRVSGIKGFTMLEMMIVLAVIMILSTIALPYSLQWIRNTEHRTAARSLLNILRETRSRAISTNFEHRVEVESVNKRFRVVQGNRADNSSEWNFIVCDWRCLPAGIHLSSNVNAVHLNSNGTANGGTIKIQDNTNVTKYEVRITRTGRIRIL
jgi:prepilin-type N-terminal cleavage/methylation domain-containing protein